MDCFWLRFKDPRLEMRYNQQMTKGISKIDEYYLIINIVVHFAAECRFRGLPLPFRVHVLWMVAEAYIRSRLTEKGLAKWRTLLVVISRAVHVMEVHLGSLTTVSNCLTFGHKEAPKGGFFALGSFTFASGITNILGLGLLQRLNFEVHFFVHLFSVPIAFFPLGLDYCQRSTELADRFAYEGLVGNLNSVAGYILEAMYGGKFESNLSWDVTGPCMQMVMFADIFVGFVVVSYTVWFLERRSRVGFIMSLGEEERQRHPVKDLNRFILTVHMLLLIVASAVFWKVFLHLGPCVYKVGQMLNKWRL